MTINEIAMRILSALKPENQRTWTFKQDPARTRLHFIFQSKLPLFLDIKAIGERFDQLFDVSWQGGQDEFGPCIVFQGRIDGKHLQAIFVLKESEG